MKDKLVLNAMHHDDLVELINDGEIILSCIKCGKSCRLDDIAGLQSHNKKLHVICKDHTDYVWDKAMQLEKKK